jgi:hypothetical protein
MWNDPPDIKVGDLFDLIRSEIPHVGILDLELDVDALWPMFQREISGALGVDADLVTKDRSLMRRPMANRCLCRLAKRTGENHEKLQVQVD